MMDKITLVLKDLIIYILPGMVIIYCSILLMGIHIDNLGFKDSTNLGLLTVGFSYIIGFLCSQLQIILFALIPRRKSYHTIDDCKMNNDFMQKLIEQVVLVFKLSKTYDNELLRKDTNLVSLCNEFVRVNAIKDSYAPIEREGYLSSFAISIYFPVLLGVGTLLIVKYEILAIGFWFSIFLFLFIFVCMSILVNKIAINFKKEKSKQVFEQFFVLSLKSNDIVKKENETLNN